jgi:hypothetical protein
MGVVQLPAEAPRGGGRFAATIVLDHDEAAKTLALLQDALAAFTQSSSNGAAAALPPAAAAAAAR